MHTGSNESINDDGSHTTLDSCVLKYISTIIIAIIIYAVCGTFYKN